MHLICDPGDKNQLVGAREWKPTVPVDRALRKFGYCLDVASLLPGDLVLVSAREPGLVAAAITHVQTMGGYAPEDARWQHAAVYVGDGAICEAVRSGVKVSLLHDYVPSHRMRFRRAPQLMGEKGWSMAVQALKRKDVRYGYWSVLRLLQRSLRGYMRLAVPLDAPFPAPAVYCSQLYADAFFRTTSVMLGTRNGEFTPASLSLDQTLVDVPVNWLKII